MTAVLFVGEQGSSALTYYRQTIPGRGLAQLGWTVRFAPILVERADHRLVGWRGAPFGYEGMTKAIVVRHLLDPRGEEMDSATMFAAAERSGQAVFYDLDDDLWHLPDHNPARSFYTPQVLRALERNLDACAGVLCSTGTLRQEVAQHTDTATYVCPNGIDVTDFAPLHPAHHPVRIGWSGFTQWRATDLPLVVEPLRKVLARQPPGSVEFVHLGASESDVSVRAILGPDWPVPIIEIPWRSFDRYSEMALEIDVAVVPMEDTAVNQARSPSTGLAFAAAGIPFTASPMPAYVDLAREGIGWLADSEASWVQAIEDMIEVARDPAAYEGSHRADRLAVGRLRSPRAVAESWDRVLKGTLRPRSGMSR